MPVFEITSPTGEVFEITAPEGASEEEILQFVQSSMPSQPEKQISRPYAALQTLTQGGTFGFGDEIQAGIGAGIAALPESLGGAGLPFKEGYQQALQMGRDELSAAREQYPVQSFGTELAGGLATGSMGAKALGTLAPKTMQSLRSTAAAAPTRTATSVGVGSGALYGAGSSEEGQRLEGAATGGVLGGLGGYVGGYVASKAAPRLGALGKYLLGDTTEDVSVLAQRTGQKTSALDNIAEATLEPKTVKAQAPALGSLTAEQRARSEVLRQAGVPTDKQTAGMITRDPKVWQFEQNIKGIQEVGDEVRNRYVQVNGLIRNKLDDITGNLGGKATTPYEAGESVTEAVLKKSREMQDEIGNLYSKIRTDFGDDVGMVPDRLFDAIDEISDDAYTDKIVTSLNRKLKRYGVLEPDDVIKPDAKLTVKQAEELRKFANKLRGDPQTDYAVSKIIDSLDDDVIDTAGTDAFAQARDKARLRFKEFESKILKNISQEKLVSDDVLRRVAYSGKVKDIQKLKESLLTGNEQQVMRGTQAWNDIKLQTLQDVIDKSTTAGGKLQGSSFARNLNKIGKERLETLFDPEELANIDLIKQALEYTTVEVPESVVNYSGTGAANANNALKGIIKDSLSGKFLEGLANVVNRTPVVGTVLSPATSVVGAGGRGLQQTARQQAIRNVLNPQKSLGQISVDPRFTGQLGLAAGVMSSQPEMKQR